IIPRAIDYFTGKALEYDTDYDDDDDEDEEGMLEEDDDDDEEVRYTSSLNFSPSCPVLTADRSSRTLTKEHTSPHRRRRVARAVLDVVVEAATSQKSVRISERSLVKSGSCSVPSFEAQFFFPGNVFEFTI
ncbi:hypothetical protein FRB95_014068, partial [Tulasnella sp. JGI-2019a]